MAAKNSERELEPAAGNQGEHESSMPGFPMPGVPRLVKSSRRTVRSALNRLIIAGWFEIVALEAASRIVDGVDRRAALREQIRRRVIFRHDLAAAVTALGGVPAQHAPVAPRVAAAARRLRELAIGPHAGDAYAVCARATERAASAYAEALTLELPPDVMFGVERQQAEIEWDRRELRRLRWGAAVTLPPDRGLAVRGEDREESARREVADERAIEVWSNEGGGGPGRSAIPEAGASLARAFY